MMDSCGRAGGDVKKRQITDNSGEIELKLDSNSNKSSSSNTDQSKITSQSSMNMKSEVGWFENVFFWPILTTRVSCIILWALSIAYATYEMFLVTERMFPFQREIIMSPGIISGWINRGTDSNYDYEWFNFVSNFPTLALFYAMHLILTRIAFLSSYARAEPIISPALSFILYYRWTGLVPVSYLFVIPVVYWMLMRFKSKTVIWAATFLSLLALSNLALIIVIEAGIENAPYFFAICCAWTYARCISYCFDTWDRPDKVQQSWESLSNFIRYVFYFPLLVCGPLVLYHQFEKEILYRGPSRLSHGKALAADLKKLLLSSLRVMFTALLVEIVYHYLYIQSVIEQHIVIYEMNLWAVCATVYWIGQIFTMKYKVLYGAPSCVAEFDGLKMYPLPCCPSYIHRYSVLWKDFDRGLYLFLVRYTYIPSVQLLKKLDPDNVLGKDIHKLIGSFASYLYVYLWHSTAYEVFVWAGLNFLGITIEKAGSMVKRMVDEQYKIEPMIWDFVIEPIVTVPLAAMSILNSSIFCGSLTVATIIFSRLLATRGDSYVFLILYLLTHTAVSVRTWGSFKESIKAKFKLL